MEQGTVLNRTIEKYCIGLVLCAFVMELDSDGSVAKVSSPCKRHLLELAPILRSQVEERSEEPLQKLFKSCIVQGSAQLHEECKSGHFSGFVAARKLASAMEVAGNYLSRTLFQLMLIVLVL